MDDGSKLVDSVTPCVTVGMNHKSLNLWLHPSSYLMALIPLIENPLQYQL